jgi:hypothetical protein
VGRSLLGGGCCNGTLEMRDARWRTVGPRSLPLAPRRQEQQCGTQEGVVRDAQLCMAVTDPVGPKGCTHHRCTLWVHSIRPAHRVLACSVQRPATGSSDVHVATGYCTCKHSSTSQAPSQRSPTCNVSTEACGAPHLHAHRHHPKLQSRVAHHSYMPPQRRLVRCAELRHQQLRSHRCQPVMHMSVSR